MSMPEKQNAIPSWVGLSAEELRQIAEFYDSVTETEWVAHDEYASENPYTMDVLVPTALLQAVRELVARHEADHPEIAAASQAWLERRSDTQGNFPPGWNSERVQLLIAEMEAEEANWTEEDDAELQARMKGKTYVQVPNEIVPAIEALLAKHHAETSATD